MHSSTSMLYGAIKPSLVVSALTVLIGFVVQGLPGFWGGLLASLVVVIFFSVSLLISRLTKDADPITTFSLAMLSYVTKLTLVAVLLIAVTRLTPEDAVDLTSFGIGALVISAAWLLGEIRAFLKLKLELDVSGGDTSGNTEGVDNQNRE